MKKEEIINEEIERLCRINDKLENYVNNKNNTAANLAIYEQIQKNTLAMCEIAKVHN